jgi:hypothetical protein
MTMKIITTLALAATAITAAPDWRQDASEVHDSTLEAMSKLVTEGERLPTRKRLELWGQGAKLNMSTAIGSYNQAYDEVQLAGKNATLGQLQGLVIRAQCAAETATSLCNLPGPLDDSMDMDTAVTAMVTQAWADAALADARHRLASFLETQG